MVYYNCVEKNGKFSYTAEGLHSVCDYFHCNYNTPKLLSKCVSTTPLNNV